MKKEIIFFIGIFSLVGAPSSVLAGFSSPDCCSFCSAWIKNDADSAWKIEFQPMDSGSMGSSVKFTSGVQCSTNGPCTIPAHTRVHIKYQADSGNNNDPGNIEGHVTMTDKNNTSNTFHYFNSSGAYICPYVHHDGDTGGTAVNDPHTGDIHMIRDTW